MKDNAKRRGKDFSLTRDQFLSFIKDTNYMDGRGRSKFDLSIDRRDNALGYHFDNIRAITVSENSIKRNRIDYVNKGFKPDKTQEKKEKFTYTVPEGAAF